MQHFFAIRSILILLILPLFLFISCATPSNVRDSLPTRVEIIQEDYQSLAKCVTQKIEVTGVGRKARISFNEQDKVVRVYEPFGFAHNRNTFEFLFIQTKENQTKVESYGYETLVGRDHYPNQIWPMVMECGGLINANT